MKSKPTIRVKIEVNAQLKGDSRNKALEWLNVQHDGRSLIPLNEKCSEKHKTACWRMLMCRKFSLTIEIDKNGNWNLVQQKPKEI